MDDSGLTCIHSDKGLCSACLVEYAEDPLAYWEFGQHPDGNARWQAKLKLIEEEMAAAVPHQPSPDDATIPF